MKRIVSTVLGLVVAATMVHAATSEVKSVNVVGYAKKAVQPATRYMLAASFDTMAGNNTLTEIFGTDNLYQSSTWTDVDKIWIFDAAAQEFKGYAQWTDNQFYLAGSLAEWNSFTVTNPVVGVGQSFWLECSLASPARNITLAGEVRAWETNTMDIVTGYQLAAYPFTTDRALQDTTFAASGATASDVYVTCDKLSVFDSAAGAYQTYGLAADGQWYHANSLAEWNSITLATNDLKLIEGFTYQAGAQFLWTETNPYSGNL